MFIKVYCGGRDRSVVTVETLRVDEMIQRDELVLISGKGETQTVACTVQHVVKRCRHMRVWLKFCRFSAPIVIGDKYLVRCPGEPALWHGSPNYHLHYFEFLEIINCKQLNMCNTSKSTGAFARIPQLAAGSVSQQLRSETQVPSNGEQFPPNAW